MVLKSQAFEAQPISVARFQSIDQSQRSCVVGLTETWVGSLQLGAGPLLLLLTSGALHIGTGAFWLFSELGLVPSITCLGKKRQVK